MLDDPDLENFQKNLKKLGLSERPMVAIGGFEEAWDILRLARKAKFKVIAVADRESGLVDYGGNGGLSVSGLIDFKKSGRGFSEFRTEKVKNTKREFLLKMEVDLLVVDPYEGVLNKENAHDVRAKAVLVVNQISITKDAKRILKEKQIPVLDLMV